MFKFPYILGLFLFHFIYDFSLTEWFGCLEGTSHSSAGPAREDFYYTALCIVS